jgi:hypothetical protein
LETVLTDTAARLATSAIVATTHVPFTVGAPHMCRYVRVIYIVVHEKRIAL